MLIITLSTGGGIDFQHDASIIYTLLIIAKLINSSLKSVENCRKPTLKLKITPVIKFRKIVNG